MSDGRTWLFSCPSRVSKWAPIRVQLARAIGTAEFQGKGAGVVVVGNGMVVAVEEAASGWIRGSGTRIRLALALWKSFEIAEAYGRRHIFPRSFTFYMAAWQG